MAPKSDPNALEFTDADNLTWSDMVTERPQYRVTSRKEIGPWEEVNREENRDRSSSNGGKEAEKEERRMEEGKGKWEGVRRHAETAWDVAKGYVERRRGGNGR